jgi:deoxycytidylate deaminase
VIYKMKVHYSYSNVDDDISKLKNENFLKIAAEIAKKSTMTQKHGCVIVHKKSVIATGYNTMPSMFNHSLHAEINAINKVKNRQYLLKDCDLYIVRIGPDSLDNVLKYSKPCPNCTRCILNCKIRRVFYSTNYEYDQFVKNVSINQDFEKLQLYRNQNLGTCC